MDDGIHRRDLLRAASAAAGVFGAALVVGQALDVQRTPPGGPPRALTVREWEALEAALAHMLPSDDLGPGAHEVNAIGYLDAVMADPRTAAVIPPRVRKGAAELDRMARKRGAVGFAALGFDDREWALRTYVATPAGLHWTQTVMGYLMEAFLCDPVHGGNPDGIGWATVGHRPGWPRPTTPGWEPKERT
jgi:gluconate 2-dehydrogenase gamma chain